MIKNNEHIRFLIKNMWHAGPFATVINFAQYAVNGASSSLILLLTGMLINKISAYGGYRVESEKKSVVIIISALAVVIFSQLCFEKFSQALRERQIFSVQQHLDKEICRKLAGIPSDILDTKEFQDNFRVVNETNTQVYFFITYMAQIFSLSIQMFLPLILIVKLSPLLVIPCAVAAVMSVWAVSKIQLRYWSEYLSNTTLRRKMDYFLGLFTSAGSLSIMKAFQTEHAFLLKTAGVVKKSVDAANDVIMNQNKRYARLQTGLLMLPVSIAVLAATAYFKGTIMVGDVIMYIGLGKTIHASAVTLGTVIHKFLDNNLSLKKLYDFLFSKPYLENGSKERQEMIPDRVTEIEIRDLTFHYPNAKLPALDGISLRLRAGNKIAIVGENGSGKTTFVKILLGLYRNYQGSVKLNGIELKNLPAEAAAKLIAPCFQDFLKPKFLFREAVGCSNLPFINDDERIRESLQKAGGDDILSAVKLTDQLGTEFAGGVDLSIGQWQKLAISRAFFGDKSVTVLDEPLSAIDLYGELQFFKALEQGIETQDLCLFVSHRMLGMKKCDEIYVFGGGKILEHGTHNKLYNQNGKYTELFNAQHTLQILNEGGDQVV